MLLADTSVWIQHFRENNRKLAESLRRGLVLMHPCVLGELACGNLKKRAGTLEDLQTLPPAFAASDDEVLSLIERRRLWGRGLGWVDAHLLAAALLSGCRLWTLDKRLAEAAGALGLSADSQGESL